MDERTFIEWDKDDIDTLGLMKVDVLALGMLSCLRRGLDLLKSHYSKDYYAGDDPARGDGGSRQVYDMLSRADSVGVFQVESRAQMSMLPRLKPREILRPRHRGGDRAARARSRATWCIPICAGATASSRSTTPRPIPRTALPTS